MVTVALALGVAQHVQEVDFQHGTWQQLLQARAQASQARASHCELLRSELRQATPRPLAQLPCCQKHYQGPPPCVYWRPLPPLQVTQPATYPRRRRPPFVFPFALLLGLCSGQARDGRQAMSFDAVLCLRQLATTQ